MPTEGASRDTLVRRVERALGTPDPALVRAFREVPREVFAAAELVALDSDAGRRIVREGRRILPPELLARMIGALGLQPGDRVLEVGTGVGYATALLGRLAREVYSVEALPLLADLARRTPGTMTLPNVHLRQGEADAWAQKAPFQAILVSPGAAAAPAALRSRLATGGRLVHSVGGVGRPSLLRVLRRRADEFVEAGAADRAQVEAAAQQSAKKRRRRGDLLREEAKVSETDVARALAAQRGLRFGTVDALMPRRRRAPAERGSTGRGRGEPGASGRSRGNGGPGPLLAVRSRPGASFASTRSPFSSRRRDGTGRA
jgi:protein-L-isoaspartate(D-aspartate) O-methyltransferase